MLRSHDIGFCGLLFANAACHEATSSLPRSWRAKTAVTLRIDLNRNALAYPFVLWSTSPNWWAHRTHAPVCLEALLLL